MKRLMDFDPVTGIKTYHDYDEDTDTTIIETVQDVESVLERNKAAQNTDGLSQRGIRDNWWHIASVPLVLIEKWRREGLDVFEANKDPEMWRKLKRKLQDPEYRYLRVGTGSL